MPGSLRKAVLGAVAATAIAGCGSDDGTIPQENADALNNRLDAIESNVDAQDCDGAQAQAAGFKSDVNLLPAKVDDDVKQGLQEAADQLVSLTSSDCETQTGTTDLGGAVPPEETEEPQTTEPTSTPTTEEGPATEENTTEEPDTTEPEEDQSLAPDNQGQGNGGSGGVGSDGGIGPGAGG